jgi:hypothetical protein
MAGKIRGLHLTSYILRLFKISVTKTGNVVLVTEGLSSMYEALGRISDMGKKKNRKIYF